MRQGWRGRCWHVGLAVILLLVYAPAYSQHVLVSFDARAIKYYLAEQVWIEKFTFRLMLFCIFFFVGSTQQRSFNYCQHTLIEHLRCA